MTWKPWRVRGHGFLVLGLTGMLANAAVNSVLAQERETILPVDSVMVERALTVQPRMLATVTRNPPAGIYTLDGQPHPTIKGPGHCNGGGCDGINWNPMVDVPSQCAGEHRCPLLVLSNAPFDQIFHLADKYGLILAVLDWEPYTFDLAAFDKDLQTVLRTFAVDPDHIALLGRCSTGPATVNLAAANPTVFSRVLVGTPHTGYPPPKAPNQGAEYFIANGLFEGAAVFRDIQRLRDLGYTATYSLQFRDHSHEPEEYDFMGHWLQESWTHPDPATRPAPYTFHALPQLSLKIMAEVQAFTTRFQQEPDSVKTEARLALVREVRIPLGTQQFSSLMADMAALAARYPSVADDFKAAGLTPQEYDAYRAAIASTIAHQNALDQSEWSTKLAPISEDSMTAFLGVAPQSVFAQNLQFQTDHPDEFGLGRRLLP